MHAAIASFFAKETADAKTRRGRLPFLGKKRFAITETGIITRF